MAAIIVDLFVEAFFGEPILVGLVALLFVYIMISKSGLNAEVLVIVGVVAIGLFLAGGVGGFEAGEYLPPYVSVFILIIVGIIASKALLKAIRGG